MTLGKRFEGDKDPCFLMRSREEDAQRNGAPGLCMLSVVGWWHVEAEKAEGREETALGSTHSGQEHQPEIKAIPGNSGDSNG